MNENEKKFEELAQKFLERAKTDMTSGEYEVTFREDYQNTTTETRIIFICHIWKVEYRPSRYNAYILYKYDVNKPQMICSGSGDSFFEKLWKSLLKREREESFRKKYEHLTKIAEEIGLDV